MNPIQIGPVNKPLAPIALGTSLFGADQWRSEVHDTLLATMEMILQQGINHFDTASGYGNGSAETLIGKFLQGRREQLFLASKAAVDEMDANLMLAQVNRSLQRLQTDVIDLYYIHWPRQGKDLRPMMEGLERARVQGKIRAIGVSNFSVEQMEQVRQVAPIHAHQLCYNLFWRFAEREIIPYCRLHEIAIITYSSIAQGVLTGKFPRQPQLEKGDSRPRTVHFDGEVWPHVYAGVEALKPLAEATNRPLAHLAIQWVLSQPDISTAIVGARTPEQAIENAQALTGALSPAVVDQMTAISDEVMKHVPDTGNMYRYYP